MSTILKEPVREPSAWNSADMDSDRSWIYPLTADDRRELEEAVRRVQSAGLACFALGREDFPLPGLQARLTTLLDELEHGRGFAMLRGMPVDGLSDDALYMLYWGLGVHLGTPLTQNRKGERIVEITDRGVQYGAQVRGYTTNARLMPHSDAADLAALFCIRPAQSGGASMIASAMTIYNEILADHPEYLEVLCRGFHHNMRGEGRTGDPNEVTRNRIPVFSYHAGRLSCHFNRRLIQQGAAKLGQPLTPLEQSAIDCVNDLALRPDIRLAMDFRAGDVQLLNNHVILHARAGYDDHPDPGCKRRLLRLWTNVPNGRPLAPAFADRTNNGPRSGMPVAVDAAAG